MALRPTPHRKTRTVILLFQQDEKNRSGLSSLGIFSPRFRIASATSLPTVELDVTPHPPRPAAQ